MVSYRTAGVSALQAKIKRPFQWTERRRSAFWQQFMLLVTLSLLHFCSLQGSACQLYRLVAVHWLISTHFRLGGVVIIRSIAKWEEVLINTRGPLLRIIIFIPIIMPKVRIISTHIHTCSFSSHYGRTGMKKFMSALEMKDRSYFFYHQNQDWTLHNYWNVFSYSMLGLDPTGLQDKKRDHHGSGQLCLLEIMFIYYSIFPKYITLTNIVANVM